MPGEGDDAGQQHQRRRHPIEADLDLDAVVAEEPDVLDPVPGEHALELRAREVVSDERVHGEAEHHEAGEHR